MTFSCYGDLCGWITKSACIRTCSNTYREETKQCNTENRECKNTCNTNNNLCKSNLTNEYNTCSNLCNPPKIEKDFAITEEQCKTNGGFYQQLCKGPFFGVVCSQKTYCQCYGVNEYTCPADYTSEKDHGVVVRGRGHSLPGWRTLHGKDLGDIGLCVKNPITELPPIDTPVEPIDEPIIEE